MAKKTLLSWSSGKDSAWALYCLQQDPQIELCGLFTLVNQKHRRASMHATPLELLESQADAIGSSLHLIHAPDPCTNEQYEALMQEFVEKSAAGGIEFMAFGDLFLEGVRRYREDQFAGSGIEPIFPLWGIPTADLATQMLDAGLEAYISCLDLKVLPLRFAGRKWSRELIVELPEGCDPCGENGEIHTIVVNGPMFRKRVPIRVGQTIVRDGFAYTDIQKVTIEDSPGSPER